MSSFSIEKLKVKEKEMREFIDLVLVADKKIELIAVYSSESLVIMNPTEMLMD